MDPVAFHIGPLAVNWYATMLALGFVLALATACWRAPLTGVPSRYIADIFPLAILASLLGARLWHVVTNWEEKYSGVSWREWFAFQQGGLVYYGGLFGAMMVVVFYAGWRRCSFWKLADAIAPSVALGYAITRFGCFMNGCCWGRASDLPWAVHYPAQHPTHGDAVHPVQLYGLLLNLMLYAELEWLYRRKKFDGQVFGWYLAVYAVLRFAAEMFRGDQARYLGGLISVAQMVCVGLLAAGGWLLRGRGRSSRR